MKKYAIILFVLLTGLAFSQSNEQSIHKTTIGFEVDELPYLTGGYYGSVWVGHHHFRYRAIVTKLIKPEFILKDGFANNDIQAYTIIADYFFKPGFKGWWVGAGLEYWDGNIQTDAELETSKYNNTIFTLGGGYV